MSKILVVCVDRDNDVGIKAKVNGPIIGKDANIKAVLSFGIVDPEDADVNTMLAAISLYENLKNVEHEDVEIVTLTGDPRVGVKSDREIARQIEEVLAKIDASGAILVSDGAEDEYIYPIISSRINIDSVKRVYVRQNASVEGTYYLITKALKDPKLRQKVIVPIALVLIILGIAEWLKLFTTGLVILAVIIGIYLLAWAYSLSSLLINAIYSIRKSATTASLSFTLTVVAITLFIVGIITGTKAYYGSANILPNRYLTFFSNGFWWWIISIWVYEIGSTADIILEEWRIPTAFWVVNISLMAIAITFWSLYALLSTVLGYNSETLPLIYISLILGVSMSIFAAMLRLYLKQKSELEEDANGQE